MLRRDGGVVERARLEIVCAPIRAPRVQIPLSAPNLKNVVFEVLFPENGVFFIKSILCYIGFWYVLLLNLLLIL